MSDLTSRVSRLVRQAIDTNVRYYDGWFRLTGDYLRDVGNLLTGAPAGAGRPRSAQGTASRAIVLEAEAGQEARGVFAVQNRAQRPLSGRVVAAACRDTEGREARPAIRFDPAEVTLDPGQQVAVFATAVIGEDMEPGVAYATTFSVPGVAEQSVQAVLRRQHARAAATADEGAGDAPAADGGDETRKHSGGTGSGGDAKNAGR